MEEELMGERDATQTSGQGNSRDGNTLRERIQAYMRTRGKPRNSDELLEHIYDTYNWLRIGMAVTAFAFPILLWAWGKFRYGLQLQGEMSAYYWASPGGDPPVDPPVRVWFVGLIFAIGFFLFLYKGYTFLEELALDLAAILLILVALVPMCWPEVGQCPSWSVWHGRFAIAFFILIALVAIGDSIFGFREVPESRHPGLYRFGYVATGVLMIAFPMGAFLIHHFWGKADTQTFWVETFGIWAFSLYWLFKTIELRKSVCESPNLREIPGKRFWRGR